MAEAVEAKDEAARTKAATAAMRQEMTDALAAAKLEIQAFDAACQVTSAAVADDSAAATDVPSDALYRAITERDESRALELLQLPQVPGLNTLGPHTGRSLLLLASHFGLIEVALALLRRPDFTQVSARHHCGWTALDYAAYYGQYELCEALLSRTEVAGWSRSSAAQQARSRGHWSLLPLLET